MTATTPPLTHDEARARAALLVVDACEVRLDLTTGDETFASHTTLSFTSAGGPTFVDLKPVRLVAATLNGEPLDVDLLEPGRLPIETASGANVLVVEAQMPFRNDGEGLHRSVDPADGLVYVYGMSFMDAAPTVFACFDQPDLKTVYTLDLTVPEDWSVAGNAPARSTAPGRWQIGPTPPLSTYFVTVVAGPWYVLREEHDGIPLALSCRQSLAAELDRDAEELFAITRACFNELHRLFGIRYPFGDYHQAFVPEFNAGAMENPGCVTIRDQYLFPTRVGRGKRIFRAALIAHEMAHQWFGNLVTPTWWDDLWLNESFAEYLGNRVAAAVTPYDDAWVNVAWTRRMWGLFADIRPTTHPVAGNGAPDAVTALQSFDGISYAKGSTILRQLATQVGDEVFFGGAAALMRERPFGNITMHDLFAAWEAAGAGDLSPVISEWLLTAGPDTFRHDRDAGLLHRTPPADHPADRRHRFTALAVADDGETTRHVVDVAAAESPVDLPDTALVMDVDHESWGLFVPDRRTLTGLRAALPRLTDPEARAAVWNNLRSGYALALVDPDDVVALLEADYPADDNDDDPWLRHLTSWILEDVLPLASPGAWDRVSAAAAAALESAAPGSERQLGAFRAAVHLAADAAPLRDWLATPPAGMQADVDVRWRLLTRLATLGDADRAELDAALADVDSTDTRIHHTRAVASLPTREGKEFAWARFTAEVEVSNYELEAAGLGLWRHGQLDLTAPYVDRYVADLPATAAKRSGWVLALSAETFFPVSHVDDHTLAATRALLEPDVVPDAVRKRVADQVDALERRLAVRAAFPRP